MKRLLIILLLLSIFLVSCKGSTTGKVIMELEEDYLDWKENQTLPAENNPLSQKFEELVDREINIKPTKPYDFLKEAITGKTTEDIIMHNNKFSPAEITITKGSTIIWTNSDSRPHIVDVQGKVNSGEMEPGDTFAHTFEEKGIFEYRDVILKDRMIGVITVE